MDKHTNAATPASKTPDYILEAHFKELLYKARLFDWLEARMTYAEFSPKGFDEVIPYEPGDTFSLRDIVSAELVIDPDFQWLKD